MDTAQSWSDFEQDSLGRIKKLPLIAWKVKAAGFSHERDFARSQR